MRRRVVDGVTWGCCSFLISMVCSGILTILHPFSQVSEKHIQRILDMPLWLIITGAIIFAPLLEEFIFRFIPIRIVQRYSQNNVLLWSVIIIVSALFGWLHGSVNQMTINGSGAIFLSIAFLRGGYITAVVAHMINNAIALLLIGVMTSIQHFFIHGA